MNTSKYTEPRLPSSALLTIDTQCDFSLPGYAAEIPGTIKVIPNISYLARIYRENMLPIIHIVRIYLPDGSNVDLCRKELIEKGTKIVIPGTEGAELVPDIKPEPELKLDYSLLLNGKVQQFSNREFVIYKPRWGAFYNTPLYPLLKNMDVDTLVICGCNFPNCPRTTIYEASERDFRVILIKDAISGLYKRGEKELENIGVVLWSTEELVTHIKSLKITFHNR